MTWQEFESLAESLKAQAERVLSGQEHSSLEDAWAKLAFLYKKTGSVLPAQRSWENVRDCSKALLPLCEYYGRQSEAQD